MQMRDRAPGALQRGFLGFQRRQQAVPRGCRSGVGHQFLHPRAVARQAGIHGGQYLIDASINARLNKTTISLFGKNLANEKGWTIGYDVQGVWSYAAPRPRRTYGVAVTQTF